MSRNIGEVTPAYNSPSRSKKAGPCPHAYASESEDTVSLAQSSSRSFDGSVESERELILPHPPPSPKSVANFVADEACYVEEGEEEEKVRLEIARAVSKLQGNAKHEKDVKLIKLAMQYDNLAAYETPAYKAEQNLTILKLKKVLNDKNNSILKLAMRFSVVAAKLAKKEKDAEKLLSIIEKLKRQNRAKSAEDKKHVMEIAKLARQLIEMECDLKKKESVVLELRRELQKRDKALQELKIGTGCNNLLLVDNKKITERHISDLREFHIKECEELKGELEAKDRELENVRDLWLELINEKAANRKAAENGCLKRRAIMAGFAMVAICALFASKWTIISLHGCPSDGELMAIEYEVHPTDSAQIVIPEAREHETHVWGAMAFAVS